MKKPPLKKSSGFISRARAPLCVSVRWALPLPLSLPDCYFGNLQTVTIICWRHGVSPSSAGARRSGCGPDVEPGCPGRRVAATPSIVEAYDESLEWRRRPGATASYTCSSPYGECSPLPTYSHVFGFSFSLNCSCRVDFFFFLRFVPDVRDPHCVLILAL